MAGAGSAVPDRKRRGFLMRAHSHRLRRGITIAAATTFSVALVGVGATTASAAPAGHKSFPGSVPSFVGKSPKAMTPRAAGSDTTVEGEIYLSLQDPVGAQKQATAVSTPGNAQYGKHLKPSQWIHKYAPTKSQLNTVKKYLEDSGQKITAIPKSRQYIVFRGPASSIPDAFGTKLTNYTVQGKRVSAPSSAPELPAKIADQVTGIQLGNARQKLTDPEHVRPGDGVKGAKPTHSKKPKGSGVTQSGKTKASPRTKANQSDQCSDYYGQHEAEMPSAYGKTSFPTYLCGYLPAQLRSAGNLDKSINLGFDGTGQTIGIVGAYGSPTITKDTNDYMLAAGEPLMTKYDQMVPEPSQFKDKQACGGLAGWQGEQSMDVQATHSVAPGANILYSGGFNCGGGIDVAMSKILDNGKADMISNSYGYTGEAVGNDTLRGQQNLHIQAAAEGIGLYFSSGDDGDQSINLDSPSPDFPASSPFVTAVGGTSEAIDSTGNYQSEVGWGNRLDQVKDDAYASELPGDLYGGGAGGGVSRQFAEPDYQKGVVPDSLAGKHGNGASRVVPDIADLADPYTGFQVAVRPITDEDTMETGPLEYQTIGGTSLAAPLVTGKMALVQQKSGQHVGFANQAIYQIAQQKSGAFHDVTMPDQNRALSYTSVVDNTYLVTLNQGGTLKTREGYDDITGVGSPKVPQLANALAATTRSASSIKCNLKAGSSTAKKHRPGSTHRGCMTRAGR